MQRKRTEAMVSSMRKVMFRFGLLSIVLTVSPMAGANTVQWYSEHLDVAEATQKACLKKTQARIQLSADAMEECQRASTAVVHSATFTPSPVKSY
jgi:hypothetical protein